MNRDVFISYSTTDRKVAEAVAVEVRTRGISCWMAPVSITPGHSWAREIVDALKSECRLIVLVFSSRANESRHVKREVGLADKYGLPLVTYRVESVQPLEEFEYFLPDTHWLDANERPLDPANLRALGDAVVQCLATTQDKSDEATLPDEGLRQNHVPDELTTQKFLLSLCDRMVQQGQCVIAIDDVAEAERTIGNRLVAAGRLVLRPSPKDPSRRYVGFPAPVSGEGDTGLSSAVSERERIFASWVAAHENLGELGLLERARMFPPLLDAIARHLTDQDWSDEPPALYARLIRFRALEVQRLVATAVHLLSENEPKFDHLLQSTLADGQIEALQGVIEGGRRLARNGNHTLALAIFDAVEEWGNRPPIKYEDLRLLAENGNERGCLLLHRQRFAAAESTFRSALSRLLEAPDELLAGLIRNNLARSIFEPALWTNGPALRSGEVEQLLLTNIERLTAAGDEAKLSVAFSLLGDLYARNGEVVKAEDWFRKDIASCRRRDDRIALIDAIDRFAIFLAFEFRFSDAATLYAEERQLCETLLDPCRCGRAFANSGWCQLRQAIVGGDQKHLQPALDHLERSDSLLSSLDEPHLYAPALTNLGHTQRLLGMTPAWITTLKRAIAQYELLPNGEGNADTLRREIEDSGE